MRKAEGSEIVRDCEKRADRRDEGRNQSQMRVCVWDSIAC